MDGLDKEYFDCIIDLKQRVAKIEAELNIIKSAIKFIAAGVISILAINLQEMIRGLT